MSFQTPASRITAPLLCHGDGRIDHAQDNDDNSSEHLAATPVDSSGYASTGQDEFQANWVGSSDAKPPRRESPQRGGKCRRGLQWRPELTGLGCQPSGGTADFACDVETAAIWASGGNEWGQRDWAGKSLGQSSGRHRHIPDPHYRSDCQCPFACRESVCEGSAGDACWSRAETAVSPLRGRPSVYRLVHDAAAVQ